jgi:hypothetical protein
VEFKWPDGEPVEIDDTWTRFSNHGGNTFELVSNGHQAFSIYRGKKRARLLFNYLNRASEEKEQTPVPEEITP